MKRSLSTIESALQDLRRAKMIVLVDDEDRENEGDLVMAASAVTPEAINFMAKYARGLICLTLTPPDIERLRIPMMVKENSSRFGTAFTVSIEARMELRRGFRRMTGRERSRWPSIRKVDPLTS